MDMVVDDEGTVRLGGVTYVQYPAEKFDPPPNGNPCYWCTALRNMRLCDQIAPYCKIGHVFIRQDSRRTLR